MLNTDIEGFNDITNSVFEENKPSVTTTSCDPNEPKKENIDPEPYTKEEPPAVKANSTRFMKLTDGEMRLRRTSIRLPQDEILNGECVFLTVHLF